MWLEDAFDAQDYLDTVHVNSEVVLNYHSPSYWDTDPTLLFGGEQALVEPDGVGIHDSYWNFVVCFFDFVADFYFIYMFLDVISFWILFM